MKTKYLKFAIVATLFLGSISFTSCEGNEEETTSEENHEGHDHDHEEGDEHEGHEH
ncbi:MAG: hypothetical protein R3279_06700 [Putridiphycobacter sp.]|nr:hypothetical protein [Putridiphycobacter sp.]